MKLEKEPETEAEYWLTIDALGEYTWRMNHDLGDGRIKDPDCSVAQSISDGEKILERLVSEVCQKFGVIHPKDTPKTEPGKERSPAPESKIYYHDWYDKMLSIAYKSAYQNIICSACPFSEGAGSLRGRIPCSVFPGMAYRLKAPHICVMLEWGKHWTRERLYKEILAKTDGKTLQAFKDKERELELGLTILREKNEEMRREMRQ